MPSCLYTGRLHSLSTPPPIQKNDPVGVIVLERVHVDRVHNETRPYSFVLQFENDDSRTYFLSAHSEVETESWIIAIKLSRCVEKRESLKRGYLLCQCSALHVTAGDIILSTCTVCTEITIYVHVCHCAVYEMYECLTIKTVQTH